MLTEIFSKQIKKENQQNKKSDHKHIPLTPCFKKRYFIVILHNYFLVDLSKPVNTISNPSTSPIMIPILILLIAIPKSNPNTIAKIKAASPLFASGFLVLLVNEFFNFKSVKSPL